MNRRATEAQFWCPFCEDSNRSKRKLGVRIEDGLVHCWVCNWSARNVSLLARKLGAKDLLPSLEEAYGSVQRASQEEEQVDEKRVELPADFRLLSRCRDRFDPDANAVLKYLRNRDIDDATIRFRRLGVSDQPAYRRRVVFASFDGDGYLNYVTARSIDDTVEKKFRYLNSQVERKDVVFNEIDVDWSRELTLVEGPFDLLSCGPNAVPMLGSWMDESYKLFERIVMKGTPVVLALDPDAKRKQDRIAACLMGYGIRVRAVDWKSCDAGSDPSSVGQITFAKLVKDAPRVDEDQLLSSRINRVLSSPRLF